MIKLNNEKLLGIRLVADEAGDDRLGAKVGPGKPNQPHCLVMEGDSKNLEPRLAAKEGIIKNS